MMNDVGGTDPEMIDALKVLLGLDDDNDKDCSNNDNSSISNGFNGFLLSKGVFDALETQMKDSTAQKAMLFESMRKQNTLLRNLFSLVDEQRRQNKREKSSKPTIVYMNENDAMKDRQVAVAITKANSLTKKTKKKEGTEEHTAVSAAAVGATVSTFPEVKEKEQPKAAKQAIPPVPSSKKVIARPRTPPVVSNKRVRLNGPWTFVETEAALKRRNRVETNNSGGSKTAALFGNLNNNPAADVLQGDSYGKKWKKMNNHVSSNGKMKAPKWSTMDTKTNVRSYLPMVAIGGKTKIKLKSGVYFLKMMYQNRYVNTAASKTNNGHSMKKIDAAIVVGEIAFDCHGYVLAPGINWNMIFSGKRQKKPPSSGTIKPSKLKWSSSKVSDPWQDGDTITFKIDTFTNTIGYTVKGVNDTDARFGWLFTNVLAFTNNHTYPDYFQIFTYCGGTSLNSSSNKSSSFDDVKFKIV